ncbi:MAG: hypothetical protein AAF739_15365 [Pseudomonadota bacterium]
MPVFSKLLLEALHQAPPTSLRAMRDFFDRSRNRLEESLDRSGVDAAQRQAYLDQFEAGAEEAQTTFVDQMLGSGDDDAASADRRAKELFSQPVVLALLAGAFMVGLGLGSLLL